MKSLILMILIGLMTSSCTSTKRQKIHVPLSVPAGNCAEEKFTTEEKLHMMKLNTGSIGKRIKRNKDKCKARNRRIKKLIDKHNKEHSNDS